VPAAPGRAIVRAPPPAAPAPVCHRVVMAPGTEGRPRPRGLTAVVVFGLVQAVLVVALGTVMVVARDDVEVRRELGVDPGLLVVVGAVLIAVGVLGAVLAVLLARGSDRVRALYGLVNGINVAVAVYSLVALREVQLESVWSLVLPIAILWFLYGSPASQEYFRR
jgi:hypothetical protein